MMNEQKIIALITTGGTIAMAARDMGKADSGVPKLTSSALLDAVPDIKDIAEIAPYDLLSKPSASLTLDDLWTLIQKIDELTGHVDGIVVTHGTDVIEETAFALSCLCRMDMPIVLTGAMRRADLPGADGPANLIDAVRVASSAEAKGLGPLVVMCGEIFSGATIQKRHSFLPHAFSGNAIGHIVQDEVRFIHKPVLNLPHLKFGKNRPVIPIFECGFNAMAEEFCAIDYNAIDALILNITGVGHTSDLVMDALAPITGDLPVIFTSRTMNGETFRKSYYGYPGSESSLMKRGCIPGGWLNGRQARMVLKLYGSHTDVTPSNVRELFRQFI